MIQSWHVEGNRSGKCRKQWLKYKYVITKKKKKKKRITNSVHKLVSDKIPIQ